jgi:hypothetical protein
MKGLFSINRVARLLAAVAAAAVTGMTSVGPAHAETGEVATWPQRVAISVALAPGQPATHVVQGELCATDDELLPGTTVQLLIDGATYNPPGVGGRCLVLSLRGSVSLRREA